MYHAIVLELERYAITEERNDIFQHSQFVFVCVFTDSFVIDFLERAVLFSFSFEKKQHTHTQKGMIYCFVFLMPIFCY